MDVVETLERQARMLTAMSPLNGMDTCCHVQKAFV